MSYEKLSTSATLREMHQLDDSFVFITNPESDAIVDNRIVAQQASADPPQQVGQPKATSPAHPQQQTGSENWEEYVGRIFAQEAPGTPTRAVDSSSSCSETESPLPKQPKPVSSEPPRKKQRLEATSAQEK